MLLFDEFLKFDLNQIFGSIFGIKLGLYLIDQNFTFTFGLR
jgi:hypothetical protein